MKKFFAKNFCFCCSVGKENKKKTSVPFVQQVAVHDILPNGNGNGVHGKPIYTNKAYKEDDSFQTSTNNSNQMYIRTRQLSQLSDISEMFRLPIQDEKSLGDVVIDEYDRKSKSLHAAESGDLSDHSASSRIRSRASSAEHDQSATSHDQTNQRLSAVSNVSKSIDQKSSCHNVTNPNQSNEIASKTEGQASENKSDSVVPSESVSNDISGDNKVVSDDESVTSLSVSFEEHSINSQEEKYQEKESQISHVNSVPI